MSDRTWSHPFWISPVSLGLSILLMGCASPQPSGPSTGQTTPPSQTPTSLGQILPIEAQAEIRGQIIQLEVARTPTQQAMGLMHRPALPDDRGMLFPFASPRPTQFWMKNVPVPLDMVFLLNGQVQAIAPSAPPCNAEPCPTYGPDVPVDQVIELRGGRAEELGIEVGDRITIQFLEPTSTPPDPSQT